jgi:hypothetical protein
VDHEAPTVYRSVHRPGAWTRRSLGAVEREGARGGNRRAGRRLVREGQEPRAAKAACQRRRGYARTWWARPSKRPPGRRRGRCSGMAMSLPDHLNHGCCVRERGGLCNPPAKPDPAKKRWGLQHLRAAKAAHLPCQVYEGKERKNRLKTTMSFRSGRAAVLGRVRPPRRQE